MDHIGNCCLEVGLKVFDSVYEPGQTKKISQDFFHPCEKEGGPEIKRCQCFIKTALEICECDFSIF